MIDLAALVLACAPLVAPDTARALIQVESAGNPCAIGVVGGSLVRQPASLPAATAMSLLTLGVAASHPAMAQAADPVGRVSTIARDTVLAITLLLMTVGVGMAGYKIMFAGASFRDVSNLFGGAIAGAAAATAAVFMG